MGTILREWDILGQMATRFFAWRQVEFSDWSRSKLIRMMFEYVEKNEEFFIERCKELATVENLTGSADWPRERLRALLRPKHDKILDRLTSLVDPYLERKRNRSLIVSWILSYCLITAVDDFKATIKMSLFAGEQNEMDELIEAVENIKVEETEEDREAREFKEFERSLMLPIKWKNRTSVHLPESQQTVE